MRIVLLLFVLLIPLPAAAAPEVAASIAPVHALTARVMQGAGTPRLLLPPGASPHDHALRPSDAAALQRAALVVRIGPGLEPWLDRTLEVLAAEAQVLRLDSTPGLTRLELREGAAFAEHDHGSADAPEDEIDPHLWLDPENARLWLAEIAKALEEVDPANAALYQANAAAAEAELDAVSARIAARLAPLRGRPFIVFHDAFHYFENRFEIEAAGAVALSSARPPGPARLSAIRAHIAETGARCLFAEPQFPARLVATVAEGTAIRAAVLDPLGASLKPGPELYPDLLEGIAEGLAGCLAD
ncbi:MAG TPA: zinc ABC transporter substrate-binding protein [Thermohalobaculum sp.]|nr:zinc ABC transporter substrate-binding protein [Thermohalobaculum sp.]